MDCADVQRTLLNKLGVRVDEQTGQYLLRKLAANQGQACAIYACDGRTGTPLRIDVPPEALATDH